MSNSLNRGISAPIAITIIIVLAVVLVGGALGYQYWWAPVEEEEPKEKEEEPKDETADWKVYSNPGVEFTFKYPLDWEIKEEYQYKSAACQMDPSCEGVRYIFLNKVDDPRPANMGEKKKFGIVINMSQCTGVKHDNLPGNNWICIFDEDPSTLTIYKNIRDSFRFTEREKAYIKVISPNGGEIWEIGKTYTIKWSSSGVEKMNIDVVDYRAPESCLINKEAISAKSGEYAFELKTCTTHQMGMDEEVSLSPGDKYKVLIESDSQPSEVRDFSDNYFSITE